MIEYYTRLLNENKLDELRKNVISKDTYFLKLCCSSCQNTFIEGGCCSQSGAEPVQPYAVLTIEEINEICDGDRSQCPFDFICLSEFLTQGR